MADLKRKGDFAELMVAADLARRGFRVLFPYGENCDYDLVFEREGRFERVQVKHVTPKDGVLEIKCRSHSLTNGKVRQTKHYTAEMIDWIAAVDPNSGQCYYVPAAELGNGMSTLTLRLSAARNNQTALVRLAANYEHPDRPRSLT